MSKRLFGKTAQLKTESRQQLSVSVCIDLCGWRRVCVLYTCDCVCTYWKYMLSLTTSWSLGTWSCSHLAIIRLPDSATLNTFLILSTHSAISFCHISPSKPNQKRNFFSRASNAYQPGVRLWNTPSTKQKKPVSQS